MPDYLLTIELNDEKKLERLVRAKNEARALSHVVKDTVKVQRATTDDVIRVRDAGGVLEQAE